MAISFVGSATGTNTAVMPAGVQAGDLILVAAFRFGNNTSPTLPAGYTTMTSGGLGTSPNIISRNIGRKIAASSSEAVGTWTNADFVIVHVYRGALFAIGGAKTQGNTASNALWGGQTLQNNSSSWVVGFAATVSNASGIETPRDRFFARENAVGATSGEVASFDTNGPAGSDFLAHQFPIGVSTLQFTYTFEILESPRAISAAVGSYRLSGADTPIFDPADSPISFIGAASGIDTATMPAHQAGDVLIVAAFRSGSATPPSSSSAGWTTISSPASGGGFSGRISWKYAASNSEDVGTWANATELMVFVYRGVKALNGVRLLGTGIAATDPMSWAAGTLLDKSGSSRVLAGMFVKSLATPADSPPIGTVSRITGASATVEFAGFDTDGGAAGWGARTTPLGAAVQWITFSIELLAPVNVNVLAEAGSYSINGADTPILRSYTIAANPGSYTISGADTAIVRSLVITAEPGSYAISGADTEIEQDSVILAEPGSYSINGADTNIVRSLIISGAGSYVISGADTPILRQLVIAAEPGSYAISGADTQLFRSYVISGAGSYSINGADTSIARSLIIRAAGSYQISGADTPIVKTYTIFPEAGSYSINGSDTALEIALNSVPINVFRSGEWVPGRLKIYRGGVWAKPDVKRYHDGEWVDL